MKLSPVFYHSRSLGFASGKSLLLMQASLALFPGEGGFSGSVLAGL